MWFKNIFIYQFEKESNYEPEALSDKLADYTFTPCSNIVPTSMGWVPPLEVEGASLVHAGMGNMIFCLKIQEKIIPPAALRDLMADRIQAIETREGRKIYGKEKQSIREDVYHTMVSQAFTKSEKIYAYIDTRLQCMLIDVASEKKAEMFTAELRKAVGALKIKKPDVLNPSLLMTKWLKEKANIDPFLIEDSCVLEEEDDDGGIVRCSRQDLFADRIHRFVQDGSLVKQVALSWQDQVKFVLTSEFIIKQVKFLDSVKAQQDDDLTETAAARFDGDFVIMSETLRLMLQALLQLLEQKVQKVSEMELA